MFSAISVKNSFGFVRRREGGKIGEEATLKCFVTMWDHVTALVDLLKFRS